MTEKTYSGLSKVLLIGCGNMGYALLKGWLTTNKHWNVHVVEPEPALRERAINAGATASETFADVPKDFGPQAIVIAVKPQYVVPTLSEYRDFILNGAVVLSVAAGVTIASMEAATSSQARIVRCMPNTPAAIGAGALVCCLNGNSSIPEETLANELLRASGEVHFVADEGLMDAVTAVSGSGPAYVFNFIEGLIEAGVVAGLSEELARDLAVQTVYGASMLAKESGQSPTLLRQQVTSPNGTTAAALDVLMSADGLAPVLQQAVLAAKKRSIELGA
jgi:pyrroline-5-carboxylate reductase